MPDINLSDLQSELAAGHPVTGPYSPDDATAADQLNAKNIDQVAPLPSGDVLQWAAQASPADTPRLLKIQTAADSSPSDDIKAIAQAADIMIQRSDTRLDLTDPEIAAMISALEAGSVLSAADVSALTVLATVDISRAAELGWPAVKTQDVRWARI